MHPEARLEGESLDFRRKTRVSRRAGVIDGRLLSIRLRSEEDECRLYTRNAWHCQAHISQKNWNFSDKEPADMRIEKPYGNKHGKNEVAFPQLLQVFC